MNNYDIIRIFDIEFMRLFINPYIHKYYQVTLFLILQVILFYLIYYYFFLFLDCYYEHKAMSFLLSSILTRKGIGFTKIFETRFSTYLHVFELVEP